MNLYNFQSETVEKTLQAFTQSSTRVILVAPTGAGKTVIASELISRLSSAGDVPILFLAHRHELLQQCNTKLQNNGISQNDIELITAKTKKIKYGKRVYIASIQTLVRRKFDVSIKTIFIDEAHRSAAKSYTQIINKFPSSRIVGLSATPIRLDNKPLGEIFQQMIIASDIPSLINDGVISKVKCFASPLHFDLSKIKMDKRDYNKGELEEKMSRVLLIGNILKTWLKFANGKKTVIFAIGLEHAGKIRAKFAESNICTEVISGEMKLEDREKIIKEWMMSDNLHIIINVMILTEGFDFPALEVAILARPTKSLALYLQMCGRVGRIADGKKESIILDHAGCISEHGLPDEKREWSLEQKESKERILTLQVCPSCNHVFNLAISAPSICPECGCNIKPAGIVRNKKEEIKEIEGELIRIHPFTKKSEIQSEYDNLMDKAIQKRFKRGWVFHCLLKKYKINEINKIIKFKGAEWWREIAT